MTRKDNEFFLGKLFNLEESAMREDLVHYDPDDLTTHGVITGMTGSGKTGLGVIMLEEAALLGIPAIVIDPKGDLPNLLLHFPEMQTEDFQPWMDKDAARREGISVEEAAQKTAALWKHGLAAYGIGKPELEALKDSVDYAVYTPGSSAGLPVSILASFSAPAIPWDENREILRERISSTVTAILGLVGMRNIDPIQAKEHILLSNIFEEAWKRGRDLDMATLITHVKSPPFDKLGVFSLEQFYPEKDRFSLAMLLNNFLAAPAFHTWLEGEPLDIGRLLYSPSGKPRHNVFYLAHLNDQERMFFITLLYTAIESWMRTQKGSSGLRAIVYFDEIAGYLPPTMNPPSKNIILRMLKQARAFGVGLVVATQNPVDLDYKALSNAGTWMIGRLQTEQDKARLLDGLEGAAPGMNRRAYDRIISLLGKRVFLLHNVHETEAQVFHTRWAMNYLAGPLTRAQIPAVNALVNASSVPVMAKPAHKAPAEPEVEVTTTLGRDVAPVITGSVPVYYFPVNRGISDALNEARDRLPRDAGHPNYLYRPALVGQARVAYLARRHNITHEAVYTVRIDEMRRRGLVRWENFLTEPVDLDGLTESPLPDASYDDMDDLVIQDGRHVRELEQDFVDWIYRTQNMIVRINDVLDVVAGPEVSREEFQQMCEAALREKRAVELETIKRKHAQKRDGLETRLTREQNRLDKYKQDLGHRRMEEVGKGIENVLGLLSNRRRTVSTSLTKRRMTSNARANVEKSETEIKRLENDLKNLEAEQQIELDQFNQTLAGALDRVIEEPVSPFKKNIFVEKFGLLWLPYYAFENNGTWVTVPAYHWGE